LAYYIEAVFHTHTHTHTYTHTHTHTHTYTHTHIHTNIPGGAKVILILRDSSYYSKKVVLV